MPWLIVDLAVVLLATVLLGLCGLGLYRRSRVLLRSVERAGSELTAAFDPDGRAAATTPTVPIGGARSSRRG